MIVPTDLSENKPRDLITITNFDITDDPNTQERQPSVAESETSSEIKISSSIHTDPPQKQLSALRSQVERLNKIRLRLLMLLITSLTMNIILAIYHITAMPIKPTSFPSIPYSNLDSYTNIGFNPCKYLGVSDTTSSLPTPAITIVSSPTAIIASPNSSLTPTLSPTISLSTTQSIEATSTPTKLFLTPEPTMGRGRDNFMDSQ
ncbi:MAG: hypothetical protein IPL78_05390 [Chloroflexi bacterium]|nr:hypothetical protein [Chloroflexota bacterium]